MPRPFFVYRRTSSARRHSRRRNAAPYSAQKKTTGVKGGKLGRRSSSSSTSRRGSRPSRGSTGSGGVTETAFNLATMSLDLHHTLTGQKIRDLQKKLREALKEMDELKKNEPQVIADEEIATQEDKANEDSGLGPQIEDEEDEVFEEEQALEPEKEKRSRSLSSHGYYRRQTLSWINSEELKDALKEVKEEEQFYAIEEMQKEAVEAPVDLEEIFVSESDFEDDVVILSEPRSPDTSLEERIEYEDLVSTTDVSDEEEVHSSTVSVVKSEDQSSIVLSSDDEGRPGVYDSDLGFPNEGILVPVDNEETKSDEKTEDSMEEKLDDLMSRIKALEDSLPEVTLNQVKELSMELHQIEQHNDEQNDDVNGMVNDCHERLQWIVDEATTFSVSYVVLGDGLVQPEEFSDESDALESNALEEEEQDHGKNDEATAADEESCKKDG